MSDRLAAAISELVEALREEARAEVAPSGPDRLLSVDEAAAILGLGRSLLYAELQSGRLRSLTVGRRRLVPSGAIAEYIGARVMTFERNAVVTTFGQSAAVTGAGIPATTFGTVLAQSDPATMDYFATGGPAVLFVTPDNARKADAVANRLHRLAIPVRVVRELLDGSRR